MVMMALLPPGGLLGGYGADPDGVNGSWEEACTCVSTSIRVRVAVAAGEYARNAARNNVAAAAAPPNILSLERVKFLPVSRCKIRYLDWYFIQNSELSAFSVLKSEF